MSSPVEISGIPPALQFGARMKSMPKPILNEDTLSEKPALRLLEKLGYEFIPGERMDPQETEDCERSSRREVVLGQRLAEKLKAINSGLTPGTIEKAVRALTSVQGSSLLEENRTIHAWLVSGMSIEQDTGGKRRHETVRFIDFDHP